MNFKRDSSQKRCSRNKEFLGHNVQFFKRFQRVLYQAVMVDHYGRPLYWLWTSSLTRVAGYVVTSFIIPENIVLNMQDSTVAQKCHSNFNLLTAISICSGQFRFAHGNFNFLTAISTCSRQFHFAHGNFNFLTANNAHGVFRFAHHLSTSAVDSGHQKSKRKIKSRSSKSIFRVKSENQKSKVDSRTLMSVDSA